MNRFQRPVFVVLVLTVVLLLMGWGVALAGDALGSQIIITRRPAGGNQYGYTGASTSDDLVAFDLASGTALPGIDILPEGNYPYDATLNRDGSEVWVAGAAGDGVVVVETISNTIVQRITSTAPITIEYPVDVAFSEHGDEVYVSSRDDALHTIAVVDPKTYAVVDGIDVPDEYLGPGKMAVNHCTGLVYAVNWYDNHLYVIDPVARTWTDDITMGSSMWDLVMDPTASTLYVTDRGTDEVHVFDPATLTVTISIAVGDDPWGIDITPDGSLLFIANENDHTVSVIDTGTNTVVDTIPLPAEADPRDVDVSSDGALAYVPSGSVTGEDFVYVIDTATLTLTTPITMPATDQGANPNVVAVAPDFASLDAMASFTATSPVPLGTPVQFFDTSSNTPTSWSWDFGDGLGTSTAQNPAYNYANPGTYTVTLAVDNACGGSVVTDTVEVIGPQPDLSIGKEGPAGALPNQPITYTLTVTNSGAGEATNLVITDTLPAGATYASGGTLVGNVVSWTVPSLAANATTGVQFAVTATQTITNSQYAVSADGGYGAAGTEAVVTTVTYELSLPIIQNE